LASFSNRFLSCSSTFGSFEEDDVELLEDDPKPELRLLEEDELLDDVDLELLDEEMLEEDGELLDEALLVVAEELFDEAPLVEDEELLDEALLEEEEELLDEALLEEINVSSCCSRFLVRDPKQGRVWLILIQTFLNQMRRVSHCQLSVRSSPAPKVAYLVF